MPTDELISSVDSLPAASADSLPSASGVAGGQAPLDDEGAEPKGALFGPERTLTASTRAKSAPKVRERRGTLPAIALAAAVLLVLVALVTSRGAPDAVVDPAAPASSAPALSSRPTAAADRPPVAGEPSQRTVQPPSSASSLASNAASQPRSYASAPASPPPAGPPRTQHVGGRRTDSKGTRHRGRQKSTTREPRREFDPAQL